MCRWKQIIISRSWNWTHLQFSSQCLNGCQCVLCNFQWFLFSIMSVTVLYLGGHFFRTHCSFPGTKHLCKSPTGMRVLNPGGYTDFTTFCQIGYSVALQPMVSQMFRPCEKLSLPCEIYAVWPQSPTPCSMCSSKVKTYCYFVCTADAWCVSDSWGSCWNWLGTVEYFELHNWDSDSHT